MGGSSKVESSSPERDEAEEQGWGQGDSGADPNSDKLQPVACSPEETSGNPERLNLRISRCPSGLLIHERTKGKVRIAKCAYSGGGISAQDTRSTCLVGTLICGRQIDSALSLVKAEGHGCASMCGINGGVINCEGRRQVTVWLDMCSGQQAVVG